MKKTQWIALFLAAFVFLGVPTLLVQAEEAKEEAPKAVVLDDVDLSLWEGEWNNMGAYLKNDDLQEGFEALAKEEGQSPEEARVNYKRKRRCEFDALEIKDGKIMFRDGMIGEKNADVYEEAEYEYKESYTVKHGNFDLEWHVFVSKDEDALYPTLLMMEVHGEEVLTHFHMRYGNETVEELLAKESWYPTFVSPDSTTDQLLEEITE